MPSPLRRTADPAPETAELPIFRRGDLPAAAGRDFLLKELDLLQSVFNKYEEWIFRSRTGLILGIGALLSVAISKENAGIAEMALALPVFSWLVEGGIRWNHWYGYIRRHYTIRDFLNNTDDDAAISLYDLQNRLMPEAAGGALAKLQSCFASGDIVVFYGVIWLLTFFAFDMHDAIVKAIW